MSRKPLVLIVDDEMDVVLTLRAALHQDRFRTAIATDGESALRLVEEFRPEIVLLDLMMPMIDGWSVIESLAKRPTRPGLVVVSARTSPIDIALAYRLGADGYITKPFTFETLTNTITEVHDRSDESRNRHREHVLRELSSTLLAD
ncbi:MAG TPA: response regulator [Actinomycetota bacterium]